MKRTKLILLSLLIAPLAWAGLETGTYISDLVATNPTATDQRSQGDDHIRLIKSTLQATFPNITGAVTPTHTQINQLAAGGGLNVLSSTVPANGIYLPSANTLGFATNTTARGTINSTGNWTINAPSSGNTLTLGSLTGGNAAVVMTPPTGAASNFVTGWSVGLQSTEWNIYSGSTDAIAIGTTGAARLHLYTNNNERLALGSAGNIVMNAPSSGATLALTGVSGSTAMTITHGSTDAGLQLSNGSGQLTLQASGGTSLINTPGAWGLALQTNSVSRLTITSAGAATFSGDLTVSGNTTLSNALPVASGGTGVTSSTGSGSVVLSASPTLTGTPAIAAATATTASSGDSSTKVATTAFVDPARSHGTNGYQKFSSGLYLQWGQATTSGSTVAVTLPTACASAPYSVTITRDEATTSNKFGASVSGLSTTGFTIYNNGGTDPATYYWQAICK